jgi:hypothetical protein
MSMKSLPFGTTVIFLKLYCTIFALNQTASGVGEIWWRFSGQRQQRLHSVVDGAEFLSFEIGRAHV